MLYSVNLLKAAHKLCVSCHDFMFILFILGSSYAAICLAHGLW